MPLAAFQDAFAQALLPDAPRTGGSPGAQQRIARLSAQPGFAVYRNTVIRGCIDALQANYPAVARLVGDEWFRAAAALFARDALPLQPTLLLYGAGFADFLARFPPAAELPYLADVARLDRAWSEAHVAADADGLDAALVAALEADEMAALSIEPHPAARWHWAESLPAYTLWRRNRAADAGVDVGDDIGVSVGGDAAHAAALDWCGEGALLTRPGATVLHRPLTRAGGAFLSASARGASIAQAVGQVLAVDPRADLADLIQLLQAAGALCRLRPATLKEEPE